MTQRKRRRQSVYFFAVCEFIHISTSALPRVLISYNCGMFSQHLAAETDAKEEDQKREVKFLEVFPEMLSANKSAYKRVMI